MVVFGAMLVAAIALNGLAYLGGRYDDAPPSPVGRAEAAAPSHLTPSASDEAAPSIVAQPTPTPTPSATPKPAAYVIKRVLPIDGPLRYGDLHWDETGAPAGPVVITVDIGARVISIFRSGYEIGTSAVIYGADEFPTPLGVYTVLQKDKHHRSSTYGGAPMPFGMRLTHDGVFIHGSPGADARYMTHGCIGLPLNFAAKLFDAAKVGNRVIVTNGETLAQGQAIPAA